MKFQHLLIYRPTAESELTSIYLNDVAEVQVYRKSLEVETTGMVCCIICLNIY